MFDDHQYLTRISDGINYPRWVEYYFYVSANFFLLIFNLNINASVSTHGTVEMATNIDLPIHM